MFRGHSSRQSAPRLRLTGIVGAALLTASACGPRADEAGDAAPRSADDLAAGYVALAYALAEVDPLYLDHSFHPARPAFEPLDLPDIERRAGRLLDAAAVIARTEEEPRIRRIVDSLTALRLRARVLAGERIPMAEQLRLIFGLRGDDHEPDGERLRDRVSRALPGIAPIRVRVRRHDEASLAPPEEAEGVLRAALAACRREAFPDGPPMPLEPLRLRWMPPAETIRLPTGPTPFFSYEGAGRGTLRLPGGVPFRPTELRRLACHEGVPGHLLQAAAAEAQFLETGYAELGIIPLYGPRTAVFEGLAAAAERLLPSDPVDVARRGLEPVVARTLAAWLDGDLSRIEAVRALDFGAFVPNPHALLDHAGRFGSYALVRPDADPRFAAALDRLVAPGVTAEERLEGLLRAIREAMHPRDLPAVLSGS